jgi:hypothetical protein
LGYWGGISPTGKIAKEYKTRQVQKKHGPMGGTMTVVDPDDVQRFYDDFYRYLHYFLCTGFRMHRPNDKLIRVSGSFITPALIR